jgi:DNA-binding transcriptional LysR family regulator
MDFRHIRAFIAVADASSITRAAERLHISQPPLSRQIQQLEQELGVVLFVRHRHGVALTEAGRRLLDKARAWDSAADQFIEAAQRARALEAGRIRIGIGWGLWDMANRVRTEFAKAEPDVEIEAIDAHCYSDSDELLRSDGLDVAFARGPFDREFNVSTPLAEERVQAIVPADSPWAAKPTVSMADLRGETLLLWERHHAPVLYDQVFAMYRRVGVTPHTVATPGAGPFNHAGMMLVASGKGFYFGYGVPLSGPQPASGVAVVPVADPGATLEVRLVSRKDATSTVRRFIQCALRVYGIADEVRALRVS